MNPTPSIRRRFLPLTRRLCLSAGLACGAMLGSGCITLDKATATIGRTGPVMEENKITKVAAFFSNGIVVHSDPSRNGLPTPGLSARIFLFDRDGGAPLEGDGSVTVFLYDDPGVPVDNPQPLELWNLDDVTLRSVMKKDAIGPGYTVWLPWSTYRPELRHVSLVIRYSPKQGREIWSDHTRLFIDSNGTATPLATRSERRTAKGDLIPSGSK